MSTSALDLCTGRRDYMVVPTALDLPGIDPSAGPLNPLQDES